MNKCFSYTSLSFCLIFFFVLFSCSLKLPLISQIKQTQSADKNLLVFNQLGSENLYTADFNIDVHSKNSEIKLIAWKDEIPHVFFHSLIAVPELAFSKPKNKNFLRSWFITKNEFLQILKQLYEHNYVLIDVYDTIQYINTDGLISAIAKEPLVPEGKIPLVLSLDDLNYYPRTVENGGAAGLFVDTAGVLACTYRDAQGILHISYENEIVLALERFIEKHPDFARPKARGLIALTAYNGFLGFQTNKSNPNIIADTEQAKRVVAKLKDMGWHFACHSWGHIHPDYMSADIYAREEQKWIDEALPIIGKTDLFIFPFGDLPFKDPKKMQILRRLGYTVFYGVERNSQSYMHGDALIVNRIEIDGLVLQYKSTFIKNIIDPDKIILDK